MAYLYSSNADTRQVSGSALKLKWKPTHSTGTESSQAGPQLRWYEGSNYVAFEAPALSANQVWILPTADGSSGQFLKTDGSGILSWAAGGGTPALDDVSAGDAVANLTTAAGNINIDSNAATVSIDGHTGVTLASSNSGDILLDSIADVVIDAAGGNVEFKDAGTLQLTLDMDGTGGAQVIKLGVDGDDLVFQQYDGTEVLKIDDNTSVVVATDLTVGDDLSLISDSAVFNMGAGNDFTITHDGTTGATLAGTPISINSTGDLTLDSTTDIVIDAAGGNVEFKDAGTLQLTIDMDGDGDGQVIKLGVDGDSLIFQQYDGTEVLRLTDGVTTQISGDLELTTDAKALKFGDGDDVTFTHDNGTGMNIASAGDFDIDVSAGNGTFTVADTKTLTLGQSGASCLLLSPHSTAGSELASLINTAGTTDGTDAAGAILLSSVAGGIGLAWADGKDLWAEGGSMMFVANEDKASCIKLHADAGSSQTIHLLNDAGTSVTEGAAAVQLLSTAGGVGIRSAANLANAVNITVDGGTTSTMTLFNDQGTSVTEGAASIQLLTDAGGIGIKSTADLANAILLTADGGTSETIKIHADQSTVDGAAGAGAIELTSDAGGISLNAASGKDIWAEGGRIHATANEDAADCIKLHADAGTSQTITMVNDAGTAAGAINMASTAGGITMKVADEKELKIGNAGLDAYFIVAASATAGNEDIRIVNTNGTDDAAVAITSTGGGVTYTCNQNSEHTFTGGNASFSNVGMEMGQQTWSHSTDGQAGGGSTFVTGAYTQDNNDGTRVYGVDTSSNGANQAVTFTLPDATGNNGNRVFTIKDTGGNAGTNNITIAAGSVGVIDGGASIVLDSDYASVNVICLSGSVTGYDWYVF